MEQIYFVLTERCNLSCSHCIRESSPWRDEMAELDMVTRALDEIATLCPQATILLSGGEPTIYKHFMAVLEHAIGLKLDIIVNSNGATSFFGEQNLSRLPRYERLAFQISLDGVETAHDQIRGRGMYRKSLRTIGNLRALNIKCTVSATVMNKNFFADIAAFIGDLDGQGLRHISIKRVTYAGRAADGSELDTQTWNEEVRHVRQMSTVTPIIIQPMYDFSILDRIDDSTLAGITPNPSTVNCGAGVAKVYVYPSGNVCSCTCFRDLPMGNLATASLQDLIQGFQPLQVKGASCSSCRYMALCRGGCLGSGYKYHGELGQADPRCPRTANTPRTIRIGLAPA
ncbi:radical SAM protein [Janthinobacterium sp. 78]|uniref:radical SAM/SPASM domain-containing protein n=1 Tax=Janthinobacterium sp. 78 TaxID=2135631 RepID=UPI000D5FC9C0|nr:radical SAM protein [Janthinobacterium sp. 78]PVX38185.1 radical SAM protein with 4Fe4S-binding SPASM domain [Janthinobacterium sp. 78]